MKAKIRYLLNNAGQKAALASNLPADRSQEIEIEIAETDFDLFSVNTSGSLSADAEKGWARPWEGSSSWKDYEFDIPPSNQDLVNFLRQRISERQKVEAQEVEAKEHKRIEDETRKQAEREAMLARVIAANTANIDDGLSIFQEAVGVSSCRLSIAEYPEAAEFVRLSKLRADIKAAKEEREKILRYIGYPSTNRETTLLPDGTLSFACPDSKLTGEWAKYITNVDTSQKGGYALEGDWLKVKRNFILQPGSIIVVGGKQWQGSRKRGSYEREAAVYVITLSGVRHMGTWDDSSSAVPKVAELYAMTPEARCKVATEKGFETAIKKLEKLNALDHTVYTEEWETEVVPRITAWEELRTKCEQALNPPAPVVVNSKRAQTIAWIKTLMQDFSITAEELR